MALMDKYSSVFQLANEIGMKNPDVKEEGGKLKIKGETEYELDKDRLWNTIKAHPGWENEVSADLRSGRSDVYGVHKVVSGDTLSKIAKTYYGNANRYMDIFNANKNILTNPDQIKVGQELTIPAK